mmetsp:Transcript_3173/g.4222  ORF Transcript_3173/g.4222 Transcript_3173/m.4222 type:complete len:355 (+) Transcript_3173:133-1197(+)
MIQRLFNPSAVLIILSLATLLTNTQSLSTGRTFFNTPTGTLVTPQQRQYSTPPPSSVGHWSKATSPSSLKAKNIDNDDFVENKISHLTTWAGKNKKSLVASAALVAAAAFANPSTAIATTDIAGFIGSTATSSSTVLEKLSETGFYQAFSLVFVSEIGDKTFFIAGLLAMKVGRLVSLVGSVSALAVMTVISVIIGQLFHAVPPGLSQGLPLDDLAAVLAFAFFGLKTLKEASEIDDSKEGESGMDEEFSEAEEAVEGSRTIKEVTAWGKIISTFGLVFAAEFGDRSFLSTIALSAAQNPVSVALGATAAHAVATAIAVAGGSYVAKYISEKAIGYIGGSLFLVFAVTTALGLF